MVSVEQVGTHLIVSDENGTPLVELSPLEDIDMVERTARTLYRCGFPTATVGLLDMAAWVLEEATRE